MNMNLPTTIHPSNDMNYATGKGYAILFLTLYASIGFATHALSNNSGEDAYPFFSWFLFVNVPPRIQTGFDVHTVEVNSSQSLRQSALFRDEGLMRRDIVALENRIGQAAKSGNAEEIRSARRSIESRLPAGTVYRVREITYDPLKYFISKSVLIESTVSEFTAP